MRALIKLFANFWLVARVYWSNYKNIGNLVDYDVEDNLDLSTVSKLAKYIDKSYSKFTYTYDGPDELFDSMRFPAQCYYDQFVKGSLRDDCDGFHSSAYHIATKYGYDAYILTYMTSNLIDSHTVLAIRKNNLWYKIDYGRLTTGKTIDDLIQGKNVIAYNLVKFNYKQKRWYIIEG